MTSLSSSRLPLVLGTLLTVGSVVGLWRSAARAERAIRDDNDVALARFAVGYLGVVTPSSPAGGYDLPRLVSMANTIANSSYWPGGFQLLLGSVALVADTIDLLPLPDTVTRALVGGAPFVVTTHGRYRVALVPFAGAPGQGVVTLGAAATWNTLAGQLFSPALGLGTLLALGGVAGALLSWRYDPRRDWRLVVTAMALGLLTLVAVGLGVSVRQTARDSTALRLLTARTLIEIAATASGVKQARLAEIGIGLMVEELGSPVTRDDDVTDLHVEDGPVRSVTAVTPRTRGGLGLRMVPVEAGLGGLWWALLTWLGLGSVGLGLGVWAAGLSAPGGLFHSAAAVAGPTTDEGSRRT